MPNAPKLNPVPAPTLNLIERLSRRYGQYWVPFLAVCTNPLLPSAAFGNWNSMPDGAIRASVPLTPASTDSVSGTDGSPTFHEPPSVNSILGEIENGGTCPTGVVR